MFGEQVELANFGENVALVNEQTARQDGFIFVDEKQVYVLGMDNCCTNHICGGRELFKDLRKAPEGRGILGIGGVSMLAGIGTI
eukprot:6523881-Ditylum_brightwellii.AAC.1